MAFENFPYTDLHTLNLDWILRMTKEQQEGLAELVKTVQDNFTSNELAHQQLQNAINDLDVDEAVQRKLEHMLAAGELDGILENAINYGNEQNTALAKQLIYSVMMSYFMEAWGTRNTDLSYGNIRTDDSGRGTAYDPASSFTRLDCSTFVLLCLAGIPYGLSKYSNPAATQRPRFGIGRKFWTTPNNNTGYIRWASDILEYAELTGQTFAFSDVRELQTGDVIFYCRTPEYIENNPDDTFSQQAYKHCAHVSMIVEGCTAFPSGVGVVEATSTSAIMTLRDADTYNVSTQYRYGRAYRPRIKIDPMTVTGTVRFRGSTALPRVRLSESKPRYSGGLAPANMENYTITETGAIAVSSTSLTSFKLPYSMSLFCTSPLSGTYNYKLHYFSASDELLQTTENSSARVNGSAYIRLEVTRIDGQDMGNADKVAIATQFLITYHAWPDRAEDSTNNGLSQYSDNRDSLFYVDSPTLVNSWDGLVY